MRYLLALLIFTTFSPVRAQNVQPAFIVDLPVEDEEYSIKCPAEETYTEENKPECFPIINKIVIKKNREILWNGTKIDNNELKNYMNQIKLMTGKKIGLQLQPYPDAPASIFFDVMKTVIHAKIPHQQYDFIGNENFYKFFKAKKSKTSSPETNISFEGINVKVLTTDASGRNPSDFGYSGSIQTGKCRIFLNGKAVYFEELLRITIEILEKAVHNKRGDTSMSAKELIAWFDQTPPPMISTTPTTPYRCIGGVIVALQLAGYMRIGFEPFPEGQRDNM